MDLSEFYDEHVNKVYKFFYIKCLDRTIAEDLTSDTFVAFMDQSNTHDISEHTKYLYGIMRNTWLQFLRSKYKQALTDIENIDDFAEHVNDHITEFDTAEEPVNRLFPYIKQLPKRQREVLVLRLVDGKSVSEVARELGHDRNYVKTTYRRAITTLRARLESPYLEGLV